MQPVKVATSRRTLKWQWGTVYWSEFVDFAVDVHQGIPSTCVYLTNTLTIRQVTFVLYVALWCQTCTVTFYRYPWHVRAYQKKPFLCTKPMAANSCCFLFMLKIGLIKSRSRKCKSLLIVCSLMQISQRWICMGYCASSIVYTFGMRRRSVWTVLKSLWAGNAWWPMILSFVPLQNHIYCSNVLRCTLRKTLI